MYRVGHKDSVTPRVGRPLNPGHPTLHRQHVTWITLNPTACPDSGVSGRYPFHANMTPYGEIQLRTDRRLDLTGIPPAAT